MSLLGCWMRRAVICAVGLIALGGAVGTSATAKGPTTGPGQRPFLVVLHDYLAAANDVSALANGAVPADAASKEKALGVLRHADALLSELSRLPQAANIAPAGRLRVVTMLLAYGDGATEELVQARASGGGDDAVTAKGEQVVARWVQAGGDATRQSSIVDEIIALAKQNPGNDSLAKLMVMMSGTGNAGIGLNDKLTDAIANDMTCPEAQGLRREMAMRVLEREMVEAQERAANQQLVSMENKPLVLAGPTKDGTAFTSADWKGKVILVDFWATWCGPCREELPRVTKMYGDYHGQGLEVLGVSCDNDLSSLNSFLQQHPAMAWPQLFDASKPGWHALATQYGIEGIPTMFLIDKKGVLRSVTARESMEELIPKLLAESAN